MFDIMKNNFLLFLVLCSIHAPNDTENENQQYTDSLLNDNIDSDPYLLNLDWDAKLQLAVQQSVELDQTTQAVSNNSSRLNSASIPNSTSVSNNVVPVGINDKHSSPLHLDANNRLDKSTKLFSRSNPFFLGLSFGYIFNENWQVDTIIYQNIKIYEYLDYLGLRIVFRSKFGIGLDWHCNNFGLNLFLFFPFKFLNFKYCNVIPYIQFRKKIHMSLEDLSIFIGFTVVIRHNSLVGGLNFSCKKVCL